MTLAHPLALLGLLLLPLLVLLERWRRRARPTLWPSLLLWRATATAEAPARRRVEPLLLYECAAVLLLSLAAAGPAWSVGRASRTIPVLLDEGPHMRGRRADGATALEATRAEVERMGDVEIHPVRDLVRAAAGWPGDGAVVLATSLPDVEGPGRLVVGRAPAGHNLGIDAVQVDGDRLWFALATDGAARTVKVAVGEQVLEVPTGQGVIAGFAPFIEILDGRDNYEDDNHIRLRRLELVGRNDTGSDLVRLALFEAGIRARAGDEPDLILTARGGTPVEALVRGADCVAADPLFDGLLLDECVWEHPRALGGDGLLLWRGRALAKWTDARTLWLGLPVDRDWDDYDTLAVLIERAKRARVRLGEHEALVGDAIASPPPGHVWTKGVDRPWDGTRPDVGRRITGARSLRTTLALLAAVVLALYLRASRRGGR